MKKRQDDKANTVLTKSIWKDAKATQLIQCRNELTLETGFRTNRCTHKIQKKKTSAVRTTERRTKKVWGDKRAGTRENRERKKAYGRRTRKRAEIYTTILK